MRENSTTVAQWLPLPGHQLAGFLDGKEVTRWCHAPHEPRPYFYPLLGPHGVSLTRMGHPGAPNHDHHRSVWVGHHKVLGRDFWGETSGTRLRQRQWLAYEDGESARMAVLIDWLDGHDPSPLLSLELIAELSRKAWASGPACDSLYYCLELQLRFSTQADQLEFGQTNYGFLGVRVAKSLSEYFGKGLITSSEGHQGETQIFGRVARWVDYSGPDTPQTWAGITVYDHPCNLGYPTTWHVRSDGWMCPSFCLREGYLLLGLQPLTLRYLLAVHVGRCETAAAEHLAQQFSRSPAFVVHKSQRPHISFEIRRMEGTPTLSAP